MNRILTPARCALAAVLLLGGLGAAQAQLGKALQVGEQATRRAEEVQRQINQLDDQRTDMVSEYRTLLQRKTAEELYLLQQQKVVEAQRKEIASLTDQLGRVGDIAADMTPMMYQMIEDLEMFVAADLPFKSEERAQRLANLRTAMERADVPPAERYRLIISAYQSEMEYGNTIDTWSDTIDIDGQPTTVDMFLYGRVALVYITPDRKRAARFDRATRAWVPLSGAYLEDILKATRVARGVAQQDVLFGPIQKYSVN